MVPERINGSREGGERRSTTVTFSFGVAVENVLRRVDGGKLKGDDKAWEEAKKEAEKAVAK